VPQNSTAKAPSFPAAASGGNGQGVETSVRQLIANGKFKTALENAKQYHKSQGTAESECLLLDAYAARIQSLLDQNLPLEANALLKLVRERFPASGARLESLKSSTAARGGDLAGLLEPLNDPELSSERRAAIERTIQTDVTDLTALAACTSLPPEHGLRRAAAALDQAFRAVTSGAVPEERIALPEVSHRSPLAPWKLLVRAIACFHRGEDDACREHLAAIRPETGPARLVPALRAMLGEKSAAALRPAEAALVSRTTTSLAELRKALKDLDRAFADEDNENRIFRTVRSAVRECQRSAPESLAKLKQIVAVRGGVDCVDNERLMAALEGAPRRDAVFFRMFARAMESSGDPDDLAEACELWEEFRQQAVREGWFRASGVEAATLYLHMADLLGKLPPEELRDFQQGARGEDRYFLFPDQLYARACVMDPHSEAFARWMRWAGRQSVSSGERVAREWHRICPRDIEPVLYLMEQAEKRNAFPTALSFLEKAERIDAVSSVVRSARLRLLAGGAMRHLQQKKEHLAAQKLAAMEALPQSRQGDRPAFLAALRHLISGLSGDDSVAAEARLAVESRLGDKVAAGMLIFGIAAVSKRLNGVYLPRIEAITRQERASIPASLARVMAIAKDLGITKFQLPVSYLEETEKQFSRVSGSLDVEQIRLLGEMGMAAERPELAWAASGVGLERGGPAEAHFMLLRARAIPAGHGMRYVALAAAAAELGRFHRDMQVVDRAVEIVRNPLGGDSVSLTLEQAREVVRQELDSPAFPGRFNTGPDYRYLMPGKPCQCPDCRSRRGETPELPDEPEDDFGFDEEDMEKAFNQAAPGDMPPEISKALFEIMKKALLSGESPDQIISRIIGGAEKQKKGRRK
jgi:hypothetical protein